MKGIQYAFLAGIIIVVLIILAVFGFLQPVAGLDLLSLLGLKLPTQPGSDGTTIVSQDPWTDINGNGKPDIVVSLSGGQKTIAWVFGADLGLDGNALRWSNKKSTAFSTKDNSEGAGVALADINGDRISDLVLMRIEDSGLGVNDFIKYKVCFKINSILNGDVGQCTADVPADESRKVGLCSNDGGITVRDINGNGKPDIILMALDSGPGGCGVGSNQDHWWYYIGFDLNPNNGVPDSGWFPTRVEISSISPGDTSRGAGVDLYDLDGNGKFDIILTSLDVKFGSPDIVTFRWIVGKDLNPSTGTPVSWSPLRIGSALPIDGQKLSGGGATIRDINGDNKPDIIFLAMTSDGIKYQIGLNLDINGNVASWLPSPSTLISPTTQLTSTAGTTPGAGLG